MQKSRICWVIPPFRRPPFIPTSGHLPWPKRCERGLSNAAAVIGAYRGDFFISLLFWGNVDFTCFTPCFSLCRATRAVALIFLTKCESVFVLSSGGKATSSFRLPSLMVSPFSPAKIFPEGNAEVFLQEVVLGLTSKNIRVLGTKKGRNGRPFLTIYNFSYFKYNT